MGSAQRLQSKGLSLYLLDLGSDQKLSLSWPWSEFRVQKCDPLVSAVARYGRGRDVCSPTGLHDTGMLI